MPLTAELDEAMMDAVGMPAKFRGDGDGVWGVDPED
jgi:hypothetical protein